MPPARITSAAVSPSDPLVLPRISCSIAVPFPSNLSNPSGVADVIASGRGWVNGSANRSPLSVQNRPPTVGQVVIATGNAACRKARPNSAGLNTFWPSPPQTTLPNPMPKAPPSAAIHNDRPAGNGRPGNTPVMPADPSPTVPPRPNARSVASAPAVAATITSNELTPKNHV